MQPDTLIPGVDSPQSWNRFSYVLNNPLRYTDPTGHYCVGDDEECANDGGTGPAPSSNGGSESPTDGEGGGNPHDDDDVDPNPGGLPSPPDYTPIGHYITSYSGAGGGLYYSLVSGFTGLDGDCEFRAGCQTIAIGGGGVPLNYAARYDITLYQNLLVVTIHEAYLIPGKAPPLMEANTFGQSTLLARTGLGQTRTNLGDFVPGNIYHPENPVRRDTTLYFLGKENFPDQLVIHVFFGAEGLGSNEFFYLLPYKSP